MNDVRIWLEMHAMIEAWSKQTLDGSTNVYSTRHRVDARHSIEFPYSTWALPICKANYWILLLLYSTSNFISLAGHNRYSLYFAIKFLLCLAILGIKRSVYLAPSLWFSFILTIHLFLIHFSSDTISFLLASNTHLLNGSEKLFIIWLHLTHELNACLDCDLIWIFANHWCTLSLMAFMLSIYRLNSTSV